MASNNQTTIEVAIVAVRDLRRRSSATTCVSDTRRSSVSRPHNPAAGIGPTTGVGPASCSISSSRKLDSSTSAPAPGNSQTCWQRAASLSRSSALDHMRFEKYREYSDSIIRYDASIVELPFDDDHFDVVTCMEVLEHVPDDVFLPGLAELRRVCKRQLVMSVPFREEEPLSKGHLRRFEASDVAELFPDGAVHDARSAAHAVDDHRGTPRWQRVRTQDARVTVEQLDARVMTADERTIQRLEAEVARLRARRSLRLADAAGAMVRRLRWRLGTLRSGR